MSQSDESLMAQIQVQNAEAFEIIVSRYEGQMHGHIMRTVRNHAAADDLVQELFLRVWTRAEQWQGQGSLKGWLYRIATNLSLNYLRTVCRRREQTIEVPYDDDDEDQTVPKWMIDTKGISADDSVVHAEEQKLLHQIIRELPEAKQEVFRLVHESELGIRGASEILGIPEGTVKSRLHYAMKQVAQEWHKLNSEWEDM